MTERKVAPEKTDGPYGALYVGGLATVAGGIAVFASAPVVPTLFVGLSGVLLICTGLIQRAIFLYR